MNDKITEKVALSINKAMSIARDNQSPDVDVPHLLRALYDDEGSLLCNILQKENISKTEVNNVINDFIRSKVKTNSNSNPYPTVDFNFLVNNAEKYMKEYCSRN